MNNNRISKIAILVVAIIFACVVPFIFPSIYWISIFTIVFINILLAASLRSIGLVGHFSLGHIGFALLGAYSSATLVMKAGISFWIAIFLSGLFAAVVALIIGYPFLKVKGIYFAVLTFLTAETLRNIAYYLPSISGGTMGLVGIPVPAPINISNLINISFDSPFNYYYLVLVIVILSLFALFYIEKSNLGFKWKAISDASGLAQSLGINVLRLKVLNFAIACFFAGLAGALFAHYQQALSAAASSKFGVMTSIYLVLYMIVGGTGKFIGPILGVVVLTLISELARPLQTYQPMIIGAIAILVVLFLPQGLAGIPSQIHFWFKGIRQSKGYNHSTQ